MLSCNQLEKIMASVFKIYVSDYELFYKSFYYGLKWFKIILPNSNNLICTPDQK